MPKQTNASPTNHKGTGVRMTPKELAELAKRNESGETVAETPAPRKAVDDLLDSFDEDVSVAKSAAKETKAAAPKTPRTAPAGRPRTVKTLDTVIAAQANPNVQAMMAFAGKVKARMEMGQDLNAAIAEVLTTHADATRDFLQDDVIPNKVVDIQGAAWKYAHTRGWLSTHATKTHVGRDPRVIGKPKAAEGEESGTAEVFDALANPDEHTAEEVAEARDEAGIDTEE